MYIEIHPHIIKKTGNTCYDKAVLVPVEPVTINTDFIISLSNLSTKDFTAVDPNVMKTKPTQFEDTVPEEDFTRIRTRYGDYIIPLEEGAKLNALLLKGATKGLEKEVSCLTATIRDLWNLLRARMH